MIKVKTVTKGWYAGWRTAPEYGKYYVHHYYGDVIEIENILFFVYKRNDKKLSWNFVHFDTGMCLSDCYGFVSKKKVIEFIFTGINSPMAGCDKTYKQLLYEQKEKGYVDIVEKEPRLLNYLNPKRESPYSIYSLIRTDDNGGK